MANVGRRALRVLTRFVLVWAVDALSLLLTALATPGIQLVERAGLSQLQIALSAALLLAIVNLSIRPAIILVAQPLGWIALLSIGFFVNALALWITALLLPGLQVSVLGGLLGGLIFAFFNAILTGILELNEEGSFFQGQMERRAREQPLGSASEPGRGLMMVEIDGLSYWHLRRALEMGLLPTLRRMMEERGYQLTRVDCGLPSMTSACQAGIMFGDNYDIPAYRWYDKQKQKVYVSALDAPEINARYARGAGLMRRGSSIMNMLDGDAEKSMFTQSNLFSASAAEQQQRAQDAALLLLSPYFLTRALALFFVEVLREVGEAALQQLRREWPRLNRLAHAYPLVRAATCTILRDIAAQIAILDMMRGVPSIYMLYLGYDEVAHHSGPWSSDAFGDLKRLDRTLARLYRVATERAVRPYDLIILSDHGQSAGPTFLQRYGTTIKQFIEQQLPGGTSVQQAIGGDTGAFGLEGVAGELANVQRARATNVVGAAVARQGQKLAHRGAVAGQVSGGGGSAAVTAYGSGNAAQVYFDLLPRKLRLSELDHAYPGMVEALVRHEGIGMVLGYADDMSVVVLGKGGRRNLHTGEVEGEDPVMPYAPPSGVASSSLEKRVWQLRRVMEFPSAGDLWLISTVYPDGSVAALEELIGNHGGLGGEQTDAFLFHPPDLQVPETRSAIDVYHILNRHRSAAAAPAPVSAGGDDRISSAAFWQGVLRWETWLPRALNCLLLDRKAYEAVAADPYMTGPALLILAVMRGLAVVGAGVTPSTILWELVLVLLWWAMALGSGWRLARSGTVGRTLRVLGFAQTVYLLPEIAQWVALPEAIDLLALVLGFLATWQAIAAVQAVHGWKKTLLPLLALGGAAASSDFVRRMAAIWFGIPQ